MRSALSSHKKPKEQYLRCYGNSLPWDLRNSTPGQRERKPHQRSISCTENPSIAENVDSIQTHCSDKTKFIYSGLVYRFRPCLESNFDMLYMTLSEHELSFFDSVSDLEPLFTIPASKILEVQRVTLKTLASEFCDHNWKTIIKKSDDRDPVLFNFLFEFLVKEDVRGEIAEEFGKKKKSIKGLKLFKKYKNSEVHMINKQHVERKMKNVMHRHSNSSGNYTKPTLISSTQYNNSFISPEAFITPDKHISAPFRRAHKREILPLTHRLLLAVDPSCPNSFTNQINSKFFMNPIETKKCYLCQLDTLQYCNCGQRGDKWYIFDNYANKSFQN